MKFSDIIGQSTLVNYLKSILASGRIAHSYIFTGPRGVGKKTISNIFAKALVCYEQKQEPCNICRSCGQFESGNHPDIYRVVSDKKTIGVDSIRDMQSDIKVKPFQGDRKIYIIDKADTMTVQAQNALLKTLEEPPEYAVIILLTSNISSLLPTVLSRCQLIKIPRLSPTHITSIVEKNLAIPKEQALIYAKLSEGLPGKALELAGSQEYQQLREDVLNLIEKLIHANTLEAMGYTGFFEERRDRIDDVLDLLELWLRDILVYKENGKIDLIINMDRISTIKTLSKSFTTNKIHDMIEKVEDTKKMLNSYANFQMAIENMLVNIRGSD